MILEVRIHLITVLDDAFLLRISGHCIFELIIQLLNIALELLLQALSKAISLLPHLEFGPEVLEALPNHLDVEDASQALLGLLE